jgi:8-oxo-dGTP diphosphatase
MKKLEVSAGVLHNDHRQFLLTKRPQNKVYGGYWEFPGGKIEPGETPEAALVRELSEELGITVSECALWRTEVFSYPHALVTLYFFRVTKWKGTPEGREGQRLCWETLPASPEQPLAVAEPLLPANRPILAALFQL